MSFSNSDEFKIKDSVTVMGKCNFRHAFTILLEPARTRKIKFSTLEKLFKKILEKKKFTCLARVNYLRNVRATQVDINVKNIISKVTTLILPNLL